MPLPDPMNTRPLRARLAWLSWGGLALPLLWGCGATHRVEDELPDAASRQASVTSPTSSGSLSDTEHLIGQEPEPIPVRGNADAGVAAATGGNSALPSIEPGEGPVVPASGGAGTGGGPVGLAPTVGVPPSASIPSVELPSDTSYPSSGVLVDDRLPLGEGTFVPPTDCAAIATIALQGQRTTVGMGVQFRVGLRGVGGLPLDAEANAECLAFERVDGLSVAESRSGAEATNALTALLVQPPRNSDESEALRHALLQLFMSRPRGERVALYRWGASVQQLVGLTNYRDSFSDAVDKLGLLAEEPVEPGVAVTTVQQVLESVADDAHPWARSVVVVAPGVVARELTAYERDVDVLWAIDATGTSGFEYVHMDESSPSEAMGHVSGRLNAIRGAGFVTFGVCGDGLLTPAVVSSSESSAERALELKDALLEEQEGTCDAELVRDFSYYDTNLIELTFDDPAQRELYEEAVSQRDDTIEFALSGRLSPDHGTTLVLANLRGGTSLQQCPEARMNFSIDFDGGRERFFFDESSGSVGSDEFYLTAMCLDPMYVNQLTMDRLMASLGMFVSGTRLVELRVDGETQGVYLLMEQVKEALVRSQSNLLSVLRRRNEGMEVKFPGEDDVAGQELATQQFDDMLGAAENLSGPERLQSLAPQLDLHRYMFFVAVQSVIDNADWGDEPTFFATATLGPNGTAPIFAVNGWDPDDVLLGRCAHDDVLEDAFGMIGCAEHPLEKAIFAADRQGIEVIDDEVYALYVDALEVVLAALTEEVVNDYYDRTVEELDGFLADPAIVAVMPDWAGVEDPRAAILGLVEQRKQQFAEHRVFLAGQLETYRASR
jgi:hypothetical protein